MHTNKRSTGVSGMMHSLALWVFVVFGLMELTGCSPSRAYESALARAFLIHRILGHVDLSLAHILSWPFWSEELPDARRMGRATYLLLSERADE